MSKTTTKHPFHILTPSPWPFLAACNVFVFLLGVALSLHNFFLGRFLITIGLLSLIYSLFCWWSDILFEATYLGQHTKRIQIGLRYGMLLFILSELMFFVSFFWAFFHSSISPSIQIGAIWPPYGIEAMKPWGLPLLNTFLLLSSGFFATMAHHSIKMYGYTNKKTNFLLNFSLQKDINNFDFFQYKYQYLKNLTKLSNYNSIYKNFLYAICLGLIFTFVQAYEYKIAPFTFSDNVYGSVFFMATGFHGLHVIIGTTFLIITCYRFFNGAFLGRFFFGVDAAVWYWHFVDVIWIFLFICIYWWGS